MSAAGRETLYGAALAAIPGPENTSRRKMKTTVREPSSGAAMNDPTRIPIAR